MGNCFSYDFILTGNKGEDFIRDIIRNFKMREYFINDLKNGLFAINEPCERNSFYQNYLIDENERVINILNFNMLY